MQSEKLLNAIPAGARMARLVLTGCSALILAACGGGGGGGGSPAPAPKASYALSGMIVTPLPEGVELEDGKGNTVKLAVGDTSFKFNEGQGYLAPGATYDVKIKAQPKGYTCRTENNTGTINANIFDVRVSCNGPLVSARYVTYIGNRADASFGFQSLDNDADGSSFVRIAFELMRIDPDGRMHRPILLNRTTGAAMENLTVRDVAISPKGVIYLSIVTGVDETSILRLFRTIDSDTFYAETFAESFLDASGQRKKFGTSIGMSVDPAGDLYVADRTNKVIRKITSTGNVTTFAGSGLDGRNDGMGAAASFTFNAYIGQMSHDAAGNLYVREDGGNWVATRKITPAGNVTTIPGPSYYSDMTTDEAGNLYFVTVTSNGIPSIVRTNTAGITDTLLSRGAVNFDSAPSVLRANAIGYVGAIKVARGGISIAGRDPMALYWMRVP